MKWEGNRQSDNIEDRRGMGGGGGFSIGGTGIGTIILGLIASWVLGINPMTAINVINGVQEVIPSSQSQTGRVPDAATQDKATSFVRTVVADTEDVWAKIFKTSGYQYQPPKLVIFDRATRTACGSGQAAMGPFYCPEDQKVYIDLSFFNTLETRLNSPGTFAKAYVIAHEVGHHIQKMEGTTDKVDALRSRLSETEYNQYSVRLELQADCYAGVWAHHANVDRQILEQGDVESAMNAAAQIGDDMLQKKSQGYAVPDSFTHGSSQQRMRWFQAGLQNGNLQSCKTFNAQSI